MSDVVTILFVLHILLSFTYAMDFRYDRGNLQGALLRFVVCFFIPFFGFVFLLFSDYYTKRLEKVSGRETLDLREKETELELLKSLDFSDEINKVPMVEALQMGDYAYRRKVVVDTLKDDDTLEYIDVLREALVNEDPETSHYASSVIMDIQGRLQTSIFQKEVEFEEHSENRANAMEYEAELYKVIKSGIYDKRDLHKYYVKYKVLSDYLLLQEDAAEHIYHDRIDIDFETEDMVHAKELCHVYRERFPSSEEMVVDHIKLYVHTRDKEGLNTLLAQLKEMPVLLTSYSLQYIRFFERAKG